MFARRLLFILAALTLVAYAQEASMLVPAVVSDGTGHMVRVQVEIRDGTGLILTTTSPLVGYDTQASERTAVTVAMAKTGTDLATHDALLMMDAAGAKQVDGPSAGGAMTILAISAMNGSVMRTDFTMTGTIESDGTVGPVGGIPGKVGAASKAGLRIIAVPQESQVYDKIVLASLRRTLNLTIIEVSNVNDVAAIAFSREGSAPPVPAQQAQKALTGVTRYARACTDCGVERFAAFSGRVVNETATVVRNLSLDGWGEYTDLIPILENSVNDSRTMLANGYYYTAANNAFVTQVDARVLMHADITKQEAFEEIGEALECVDGLERPTVTRENVAFVAGGDARAVWARERLKDLQASANDANTTDKVLSTYRDTLYAQGWCTIAKEMYAAAASVGGSEEDESILKQFAGSRLNQAEFAFNSNPALANGDNEWHLRCAEAAFNASQYSAAILDADYVLGSADAENVSAASAGDLAERAQELAGRAGSGLWSSLFYAHAKFFLDTGGASGMTTALRIGSMAARMEEDGGKLGYFFDHPDEAALVEWVPPQYPQTVITLDEGTKTVQLIAMLLSALLVVSAVFNIIVFTKMNAAIGRMKYKKGCK